jgi:hypothetical protein
VNLKGDGMNRRQAAQQRQKRMYVGPRQLHLATSDIGEFVENLHADSTAITNGGLGLISLYRIARRNVEEEDVGVEEVTWHYLKIFDRVAR